MQGHLTQIPLSEKNKEKNNHAKAISSLGSLTQLEHLPRGDCALSLFRLENTQPSWLEPYTCQADTQAAFTVGGGKT